MARGQISKKGDEEAARVYCATCLHFRRDTSGYSLAQDTGEYYMGECLLGLNPDHTLGKQFANKPRKCSKHKER